MPEKSGGGDFSSRLTYSRGMKVVRVLPPVDCGALLPGHDFADAYAVSIPEGMNAAEAARRAFANAPRWAVTLMNLRDRLVEPLGLKPAPSSGFPVISETSDRVVMGFNDRHLDFRIVVTAVGGVATLTTIVRRHNLLGRAYLFAILPFHRLLARAFAAHIA
jgi:hypothetical protein